MKRVISMILVVMMVCGLFAGCGGAQTGTDTPKATEAVGGAEAVGEAEKTEEPKELDVLAISNAYVENIETNAFTLWYEEYSGVHVNWEVPSGDFLEAFNLKIIGEDLPDIVYGQGFDIPSQKIYGQDEIFIDLSDLIEEHAPNFKSMLDENPELKEVLTMENGAIYGMPRQNFSNIGRYEYVLWVYEPWLDALDVKAEDIKTTDDLYNLFKKVKETDLNGNGVNDEIPLATRGVNNTYGMLSYLMNNFTFCVSTGVGSYLIEEEDGVTFAANTEAWREGLEFIHKLNEEALIQEDSISLDRTTLTSMGESETPVLFSSLGLWAPYFTTNNSDRSTQYVAIAPVTSPSGYTGTPLKSNVSATTMMHITTACEDPVTAIKWLDGLWDEEPQSRSGATSTVPATNGEIAVSGKPALYVSPAKAADVVPNSDWGTFYMQWRNPDGDLNTYFENPNTHAIYVNRAEAQEMYEPYAMDKSVNAIILEGDKNSEYTDLKKAIEDCVVTNATSFITGEKSLETDWDAYLKELEGYGLSRYLELVNEGLLY